MEPLYAYVKSWVTEEQYDIPFPSWKGVGEYWGPVDPTSSSENYADVFPEVASLLNYHVEWTVILNYITKYNNKVLVDESNKTVKFLRIEMSMEEAVSKFQSLVVADQQNGGPHKKRTLA